MGWHFLGFQRRDSCKGKVTDYRYLTQTKRGVLRRKGFNRAGAILFAAILILFSAVMTNKMLGNRKNINTIDQLNIASYEVMQAQDFTFYETLHSMEQGKPKLRPVRQSDNQN